MLKSILVYWTLCDAPLHLMGDLEISDMTQHRIITPAPPPPPPSPKWNFGTSGLTNPELRLLMMNFVSWTGV